MSEYIAHHGIKGQKWGVRRYQNPDGTLTAAGKERYRTDLNWYKDSNNKIKTNSDGSSTFKKGFVFNRVGQSNIDVNKSGALYVSYGARDAAQYVKSLGPTKIGKLMGQYGTTVQHLTVKSDIKMASSEVTADKLVSFLKNDNELLKLYENSFYSMIAFGDKTYKRELLDDPKYKNKIAYSVSSMLANTGSTMPQIASRIYSDFRKDGYDAIPDLLDSWSGVGRSATIIINPNKVELTSSVEISKDVMSAAKKYIKDVGYLPMSELIK